MLRSNESMSEQGPHWRYRHIRVGYAVVRSPQATGKKINKAANRVTDEPVLAARSRSTSPGCLNSRLATTDQRHGAPTFHYSQRPFND